MAVRLATYGNTNYVTEKLVAIDRGFHFDPVLSPEGFGYQSHAWGRPSFYLRTAGKIGINRRGTKIAKIKILPSPRDVVELLDWNFWPMPETNLWVGTDRSAHKYSVNPDDHGWDDDICLRLYLFNSKQVIRQKELQVFAPGHENDGYPDFRFDALYQHVTYKTRHGYKTYDLWNDTIVPCETPSGEPAIPIKNPVGGFDLPLTLFIEGRPVASYRDETN